MTKPVHLLQEIRCPGRCKRELYEGDVCYSGTCEYNIHDPYNAAQKAELEALVVSGDSPSLLPVKPIEHVVTVRPSRPLTRKRPKLRR